ncbi:DUF1835 domain-containing protein [Agrobacterium rhizogenes]|uniref:DUF3658 domain-containing protein n=1 Tax=Rhizobium rhizogenes TaxID=359 RepID=UPI0015740399|nr:DUF3658 domain-containing protein [Rhizobium rhizogenes]NTG47662.1 DUF1835 domain-containing protein [Rhizobium rhizogenes]
MRTSHVVPGDSAAGSLRQALRATGRDDELLVFRDDLSCGPIASNEPAARVAWWRQYMELEADAYFLEFWQRVDVAKGRIVVWFGRHSARELAFRLAWAWHMRERSYYTVDVTGLRISFRRKDGSAGTILSAPAVAMIPADGLITLFGSETLASDQENARNQQDWKRLTGENAPFRIVTPTGLASAPLDYFDRLLLEQTSPEWRKMAYIVGNALGLSSEPYFQVGDMMLQARLVALIDQGSLIAEGDPWDMRACRVRLPD